MIHIVLYQPEKPQNTGNIMRTCVAINAHLHIIGPITFSIDCKDLKRVGLDYIDNLKLTYYNDYSEFDMLHHGKHIYYISRYGKNVYSEFKYPDSSEDVFLMFGRESTGIPHDILRSDLDHVFRIPMVADARSLNLSNCVALVAYEVLRQQKFPELATHEAIKGEDFLINEVKMKNDSNF